MLVRFRPFFDAAPTENVITRRGDRINGFVRVTNVAFIVKQAHFCERHVAGEVELLFGNTVLATDSVVLKRSLFLEIEEAETDRSFLSPISFYHPLEIDLHVIFVLLTG